MSNTPTPAAMRAARTINEGRMHGSCDNDTLARIIDRETGLAELVKAAELALLALAVMPPLTWGKAMFSGRFDEICRVFGLNPWAANEGRAQPHDEISIDAVTQALRDALSNHQPKDQTNEQA